jgi:nucleoside-diphosphate-sugar epimerase
MDDRGPRRLSNEKAERELGWQPRWRSWREGFREALTDEQGPAPFPEAAA